MKGPLLLLFLLLGQSALWAKPYLDNQNQTVTDLNTGSPGTKGKALR